MSKETRQYLLGTWKLVTAVREEVASGTKTEFLGSKRLHQLRRRWTHAGAHRRKWTPQARRVEGDVRGGGSAVSQRDQLLDQSDRGQRDHPLRACLVER